MEDVPYANSSKLVTDVPLLIKKRTYKETKERYTSLSKYLVDSLKIIKRVQNTHESVA